MSSSFIDLPFDPKDADKLDIAVFNMHNTARTNPAIFVKDLELMKDKFDGLVLKRPGKQVIQTREGVAAVDEAI